MLLRAPWDMPLAFSVTLQGNHLLIKFMLHYVLGASVACSVLALLPKVRSRVGMFRGLVVRTGANGATT